MLDKIIMLLQNYGGLFLKGTGITIMIAAITVFFGTLFGILLCILRQTTFDPFKYKWMVPVLAAVFALPVLSMSGIAAGLIVFAVLLALFVFMSFKGYNPLHALGSLYVEIIRGTPMLLQIYLIVFLLPDVLHMDLEKLPCVIVALCMNSAAYVSELIRSGIQAVDKGQAEAARSLGLSSYMTMKEIVLPQAIKNILPAICSEFIMIIKDSSLGSVFFVGELMTVNNVIKGALFLTIEPLMVVGGIYLILTFTLSKAVGMFERRLAKGD